MTGAVTRVVALVCPFWLGLIVGCGAPQTAKGTSDAIVRMRSNVADAQVYVDGHYLAPVALLRGGIAVEPGTHRFELRHEAYFSRYLELTLDRGERKDLGEVKMVPILP
jgi:hypothetical protein